MIRYNQLAIDLREGKHVGNIKWRVIPLYVEVGYRGTVNQRPWYGMCNDLGFTQTITRTSLVVSLRQQRRLPCGAATLFSYADS